MPRRVDMLDFTTPHLLRNEAEYEAAVAAIGALLDEAPPPGSPGAERLEFLSLLVEEFDARHYSFADEPVSPQAVVEFALEARGLERSALAESMGGRSRISDFFNGKRPLSMGQVVKLRALLGVPADLLIAYPPGRAASAVREPRSRYDARKQPKRRAVTKKAAGDARKTAGTKRGSKKR